MPDNTDDERAAKAREITRAYTSTYNAEHREERAAYMKEWEAKNREARNAYKRDYYAANRDKIAADSAIRVKEWNEKNRERRLEIQRNYRQRNKDKLSDAHKTYVLTSPTYAAVRGRKKRKIAADMETLAGRPRPEVCDVCGRAPDTGKSLHFDHSHAHGHFRGWLCRGCNLVLGHVSDDPTILRKLADYLDQTLGVIPHLLVE
jgi:hypothetical protein